MSREAARAIADRIYTELLAEGHTPGFIRMIIRDLVRNLNRDQKPKRHLPPRPPQAASPQ